MAGVIECFTNMDDAVLVEATKDAMDALHKDYPYWWYDVTPANTYEGQTQDVGSFVGATCLIANKDVPDDVVYAVVKNIFEHSKELAEVHPSCANFTLDQMKRYFDMNAFGDAKIPPRRRQIFCGARHQRQVVKPAGER